MRVQFFLFFLLSLTGLQAQGRVLSLEPIPIPTEERPSIDPDGPGIGCGQIVQRLEKYNEMARTHDLSVTGFLGEVVQKLNDWHGQLQPLEGAPGEIPSGAFWVLEDGATKISQVMDRASDNTGLLANELDRIIQSLHECLEASQASKTRNSHKQGGK
jgi:hypothetical protein